MRQEKARWKQTNKCMIILYSLLSGDVVWGAACISPLTFLKWWSVTWNHKLSKPFSSLLVAYHQYTLSQQQKCNYDSLSYKNKIDKDWVLLYPNDLWSPHACVHMSISMQIHTCMHKFMYTDTYMRNMLKFLQVFCGRGSIFMGSQDFRTWPHLYSYPAQESYSDLGSWPWRSRGLWNTGAARSNHRTRDEIKTLCKACAAHVGNAHRTNVVGKMTL